MILLFTKTLPDKDYSTNQDIVDDLDVNAPISFKMMSQPIASFFAPTEDLSTTCKYPIDIRELFPYWLRLTAEGNSVLISLTQSYYDWLSCNINDINDISFFRLEDLIDTENIPESLVEHLAYTYLNSLSSETITQNIVSPDKVLKIIDNVKTNLYSKKGAENGFKYVINEFFGIDPDTISVSYPKRYVLRLNGGRYDWMRDNLESGKNYTTNLDDFYPQLTGSILNYSVIQDNYLWQEHSYVINVAGLTKGSYESAVKPLLHPAGTQDFFDLRQDIFNNIEDTTSFGGAELPLFQNYSMYKLGSTASIGYTLGCSGAAAIGGVTAPIYVFPNWDAEIYAKYYPGMSFGEINIGDFLELLPAEGFTYPNNNLTCP